jgi:capsular polysaccharide biosynthesis protein
MREASINILLHGFGSFPIFFKQVIEAARERYPEIQWAVILPTLPHIKLMRELLGKDRVLYLYDELPEMMNMPSDLSITGRYPSNLFQDIETDKFKLKRRAGNWQVRNALATYRIYKTFLEKVKPSHVLFGHVETHEGMILDRIARELGVKTIYPAHFRNLGGSFFSSEVTETLPPYAQADEESREKAKEFVEEFRQRHVAADNMSFSCTSQDEFASSFEMPPWQRLFGYVRQLLQEPEHRSWMDFKVRALRVMPWWRDTVWGFRTLWNSRHHTLSRLDELPRRFIYYPLQYTPESSINVPAPYFVDQRRVIDLIRFSMPSDVWLVVKEHPSCIKVRPSTLVRKLLQSAGVLVAHYKMDSRELIQRAALTVSVTGTATLEAYLLGRPSLCLGPTFFSEFLGGVCGMDELPRRIRELMGKSIPDPVIIDAIAKVYSVCKPYELRCPYDPNTGRMIMGTRNISNFLDALIEHIQRTDDPMCHRGPSKNMSMKD